MVTWNIRVLSPILHHLYQSCMAYHLRSTSANSSGHRTCFDKMKQREASNFSLSVLIDFVIIDRQNQRPMILLGRFCVVITPSDRCHKKKHKIVEGIWIIKVRRSLLGGRFPIENGWKWEVFFWFSFEIKSILIQSAQSSQEWNLWDLLEDPINP